MQSKRISNMKTIKTCYFMWSKCIIRWKLSEAIIINLQLEAMSYIKVSLSCFDDKRYSFTRGWQKFIHLWSLQNPTVNELNTKQNFRKNFTVIVKWKCELFDWARIERGIVTDQLTALFGDSSVPWFLKVQE